MPKLQTNARREILNGKKCAAASRISLSQIPSLYKGPSEEPEIIFADMLRARMVSGSEATQVGDKSWNQ